MNSAIKSKVLLFLIALAIPTVVFIIMAYMMSLLLKGDTTFVPIICTVVVTYLLMASAFHINNDANSSLGLSAGIIIGVGVTFAFLKEIIGKDNMVVGGKEGYVIIFICAWALSVFSWTYNLFFEKQEYAITADKTNNETDENSERELIGGWYGVDSQLSCWLPVLAFEKNNSVTYSDGEIVKEYSYHVSCSTCIILTTKDGEKIFVKRVWVKGKPHLFYNGQIFTQDGKHSE